MTLDARPENLALTRLALAGVAANSGAPREVVSDLKLAVTEACTNVIKHAYGDDPSAGEIVVRYTVERGQLSIEVEDSGAGFELDAPPASADRNGGGNGLMIIRVLTDELSVTSAGTGTRVAFVKRFSPED
ncbi:MAG TPA: ATP-binding protein [Gaiellaceae bacterium]